MLVLSVGMKSVPNVATVEMKDAHAKLMHHEARAPIINKIISSMRGVLGNTDVPDTSSNGNLPK